MTSGSKNIIILAVLVIISACSPKKDEPSPNGGVSAPVSNGTGSLGGGGNGIDEKMLESFAFSIETLPEYSRYIAPIIRKIGRGRSEVFRNYMTYGVKNKIWYMIPRPLSDLSNDQIGTGFSTEQYALNNDQRVYIAKASYLKMNHKERANLLMHEIVMSARLLMKKTPKEQCEKLPDAQVSKCNDPEMMKIAEAIDVSESERGRMDTQDHDAVRAMTIFLMQPTSDVSATTVAAKRRELGFVFPWDKAISNLSVNDLRLAFERARLSGQEFIPAAPLRKFKEPVELKCLISTQAANEDELYLAISPTLAQPVDLGFEVSKAPKEWLPIELVSAYESVNGISTYVKRVIFDSSNFKVIPESFEARGIVDPTSPRRVVDKVTLRPLLENGDISRYVHRRDAFLMKQVEILITRDEIPKILRIGIKDLNVQFLKPDQDERVVTRADWEFVPMEKEAFNCTPSMTANAR